MSIIKTKFHSISKNDSVYFIADIGANHDGSLERAKELIGKAAEAGADAAKFQNFKAEKIVSRQGFEGMKKLTHQSKWNKSVFDVYEDASISIDWTKELKKSCHEAGIDYFTSPYDFESVDHVDPHVDVYKIGSGDITWLEIIEYIADKKKPILLATGASNFSDVTRAMDIITNKNVPIVLMQCNTNYTGSKDCFKYINLNVLKKYESHFPEAILGLSDHTPGHSTVLGSVALGAKVIEKHFTDDNKRNGPDHGFAMNPNDWFEMVERTRELEAALGTTEKKIEDNEIESVIVQRRALRLKSDMSEGSIIREEDLEALRPIPAGAYAPYRIQEVVGKKLVSSSKKGDALTKDDLA